MTRPCAAIDIGSNTLRLLIAESPDTSSPEAWKEIAHAQRITRLGQGLHTSGRLTEKGIMRTLDALREFAGIIKQYGIQPKDAHAVATAAVRESINRKDFIERCAIETGIKPHVIDGNTEARLSLRGAAAALSADTSRDMLLFDIGGGSTEFIRVRNGKVVDDISRKLGVVRLVEAHLASDPPSADNYQSMLATASKHLDEVETHWHGGYPPAHLVGTAGTITTLAALHMNLFPYDAKRVNNHVIPLDDFLELKHRLLNMTHSERAGLQTVEAGREDLIIAGLAITEAVMQHWNYDALLTVDSGLLEGAWLESTLLKTSPQRH